MITDYVYMDVPHIGKRGGGGSMRTRYFGKLEGVKEETLNFAIEEASRQGMSIHDWLEKIINEQR